MGKKEIVVIEYSENTLTLDELCEVTHLSADTIRTLIDYDIIHPVKISSGKSLFDVQQMQRLKVALRLQHDLEVNLAGVAVMLDLLEELDDLRVKVDILEKHLMK